MTKKGRRRLGYTLFGLFVLFPLLAFGISNLYLLSPKGRDYIQNRIGRIIPLEARVRGATWSPWNGITIYGIRLEQPGPLRTAIDKPLLSVQSIRFYPEWASLARMKLEPKAIDILRPEINLPLELLSQIRRDEGMDAVSATAPDLASSELKPGSGSGAASPAPGILPPAETSPHPVTMPVADDKKSSIWVNVRQGRLAIVTLMHPKPVFLANGINGSLPLAGKAAESEIRIERLEGVGGMEQANTTVPIKWAAPILSTGPVPGELCGLECLIRGQVGLVAGMPFGIDANLPAQNGDEFGFGADMRAKTGSLEARGRMQGYLVMPATWQGLFLVQATGVDTAIRGKENRFDQGRALVVFRNGALRCPDARLSCEDTTIICNATLLGDSRIAANARIIASPQSLLEISQYTRQDGKQPRLTPLSTPQRAALDLQLFGRLGKIFYKPDPYSESLPLQ